MRDRWAWAIAGVAAAALALGAGELVGGVLGGPSLIAAMGTIVIDLQPPGAKDLMVALFGDADKLVLEVSTAIGALAAGALLGLLARRDVRLGMAGFVVFGAVAFLAALRDPLVDLLQAVLTAGVAVG